MDSNFVTAMEKFHNLNTIQGYGECFLKSSEEFKLDFDGETLRFSVKAGEYKMGPISSPCLITGSSTQHTIQFSTYISLKNVRHANIVTVENFCDQSDQPRIIYADVDGTLKSWLEVKSNAKRFFATSMDCPSSFRKMAVDLSSAMEYLFKLGVYPFEISLNDIYICTVGGSMITKILIREAMRPQGYNGLSKWKGDLWNNLKKTLDDVKQYDAQKAINSAAERFLSNVGKTSSLVLNDYPDAWSDSKKTCYLMTVIASRQGLIRQKLQNSGITWPRGKYGKVLPILKDIMDYQKKLKYPVVYDHNNDDPYDYLKLCRHTYKHWDTIVLKVHLLKSTFSDRDSFIRTMESWDPHVWCKLFEAVGWTA